MLATSGFGPAHVLSKVFAKPGESQLTEIAQPNFRSGSKGYFDLFLWFEEIDNQIAKRFFRAAQGVARAALLQHERAIAPRGNGGPKEPPAFFASAEYAKTVRDWFETATRQKLGVRDSRFSPDEAPRKEKLLA